MKIIVLDYYNVKVDILEVDDSLVNDENMSVEDFLSERGYKQEQISYMTAPIESVPVTLTKVEVEEYGNVVEEKNDYVLTDGGVMVMVD